MKFPEIRRRPTYHDAIRCYEKGLLSLSTLWTLAIEDEVFRQFLIKNGVPIPLEDDGLYARLKMAGMNI